MAIAINAVLLNRHADGILQSSLSEKQPFLDLVGSNPLDIPYDLASEKEELRIMSKEELKKAVEDSWHTLAPALAITTIGCLVSIAAELLNKQS